MPVLDHTIVESHDHRKAAGFLAEILGLEPPSELGPFALVRVGTTTTLDFIELDGPIASQHYAFLVTEVEFDQIFARITDRELPIWADPGQHEPGRTNSWDGGRAVYFEDPSGHLLEILTRPYGTGGTTTDHPHPLVAAPTTP
ncbi:MAG: VOC family protein [Acidimicrobiia bacterium]